MATTARRIAFEVLRQSDRGGELLAERLARPDAEALPPRDRAFLHTLVLGTLRQRGRPTGRSRIGGGSAGGRRTSTTG